jgi:hypothetical protein
MKNIGFILTLINMGIKNRILTLVSNPVKKLQKSYCKKLLTINVYEHCCFHLLVLWAKVLSRLTFFSNLYFNFFNRFEIGVKFCVFFIPILNCCERQKFAVCLALFANFEAKHGAQKNEKELS